MSSIRVIRGGDVFRIPCNETDTLLGSHVSAVAYEDVQDEEGKFPLLRPMSELAGKGGFLAALHFAQSVNGGPGKLLANVAGVERPVITCLGCGNIGIGVAELACGMGNEVRILDVNMDVMLEAKKYLPDVSFMISNRANLEKFLKEEALLIIFLKRVRRGTVHTLQHQLQLF